MDIPLLRHQSLASHIEMAGLSVSVLATLLLVIAFFPAGLQWWVVAGWMSGWAGSALLVCVVCVALLGVAIPPALAVREAVMGDAFLMSAAGVVFVGMTVFLALVLVQSQVENIGPLSLARISAVHSALEDEERALADLPLVAKTPAGMLDDIVEFRLALASPSHGSLRVAHDRLVGRIQGERCTRAVNAAVLLGLSRAASVQAARVRGWMRRDELRALQDAARDLAAQEKPARLTPLQSLAFLALVQPGGLDTDIDFKPTVRAGQGAPP